MLMYRLCVFGADGSLQFSRSPAGSGRVRGWHLLGDDDDGRWQWPWRGRTDREQVYPQCPPGWPRPSDATHWPPHWTDHCASCTADARSQWCSALIYNSHVGVHCDAKGQHCSFRTRVWQHIKKEWSQWAIFPCWCQCCEFPSVQFTLLMPTRQNCWIWLRWRWHRGLGINALALVVG